MALPLPVTEVRRVSYPVCPVCRSVTVPTSGPYPRYRCPHGHGTVSPADATTAGPPSQEGQARRLPSGTYEAQSVTFENPGPFPARWQDLTLGHLYSVPLPNVFQAPQAGDGRLQPGPVARGGGSKSRRKRKTKGGKKMIGEEWQAG